jgi:hypothetical protein
MDRDHTSLERPVADALRALKETAVVPPVDPAHEAALLAAFDASVRGRVGPQRRRDYWYLAGFAAAAALFLAAALPAALSGGHGTPSGGLRAGAAPAPRRDVQAPPPDFIIVPGAAELPRMESGTLVRMDVPVSMLPSLGVTPPPGQARAVTADFIVAQDGLPRAVRLVSP